MVIRFLRGLADKFQNFLKTPWPAVLLLVIHIGLALGAFSQWSLTSDEPIHLSAGYSYWRTAHPSLNPEHPPLAKVWASLPMALTIDLDPQSLSGWATQ